MSMINRMYGKSAVPTTTNDKNPNRVAGGLRGQGADHYVMLGEDGMEKSVPTHRYVQSLEEQTRVQKAQLEGLQKRLNRINKTLEEHAKAMLNMNRYQ